MAKADAALLVADDDESGKAEPPFTTFATRLM
jgi:hypothetical protein